jgi:hypothetical protein
VQLDHIFIIVADGAEAEQRARQLGLAVTYRRRHPGQGTENLCCCFENLFIELLWVHSEAEVRSPLIQRTMLYERSLWRTAGTCPFGIAWRNASAGTLASLDCWPFEPPYLPAGVSLPVTTSSDDPKQPMLFGSPGTTAPRDWPTERRGLLQYAAGMTEVTGVELGLPAGILPSASLQTLAQHAPLSFAVTAHWSLTVEVARIDGAAPSRLVLSASPE